MHTTCFIFLSCIATSFIFYHFYIKTFDLLKTSFHNILITVQQSFDNYDATEVQFMLQIVLGGQFTGYYPDARNDKNVDIERIKTLLGPMEATEGRQGRPRNSLRAQSTRLSSKQPNNVSTSSADVALSALK
jgi:hypothetical protein